MEGPYGRHVAELLADAMAEFGEEGRIELVELADAVLALDPDNAEARQLLRRVDGGGSAGERRQLTVMFCDVVGSTALSSQVDPEITREVLRSYQGACGEVVSRFDGHIALYVGDGTVAYFGYPRVHEDDPRRAVEAALELLEALRPIAAAADARHGVELAVRIAVHTGFVVRAEMGGPERRDRDAIVGEAPNLTARLQEQAEPNTVIISGSTEELTRGFFLTRPLGPQVLRGLAEPVEAFRVLSALETAGRLDVQTDLTRFVGRQDEVDQLWDLWRGVADGGSSVALIRGEPGIGKSRLAAVHRQRVEADDGSALSCSASAFHTSTQLYPVRQLVQEACGIVRSDDPRAAVTMLHAAMSELGREDLLGAFADLLGVPPEAAWSKPELDGPQLRELMFAGLTEWAAAAAARTPLVVVIDDLQWADPTSLDLIGRVAAQRIPGLMLVLTARSEFAPPWEGQITTIDLERLDAIDLRLLAASIPAGSRLDEAHLDDLVARSDGVPLYLEELVRSAGVELRAVDVATTSVPLTLVDALLARLAAPGVDLSLAQMIATIGHEADREILAMVTGLDDRTLDDRLGALVDAHLVEVSGGDDRSYRFRHQLMGELAYDTQLLPVRRRRHSAVADVLSTMEVHGVPADAGEIGYHLEYRAERYGEAVDAYVRSARVSLAHGGAVEAERQLDHALEILDGVADEKERAGLEIIVRQDRGMAAVSTHGYTSLQAQTDFHRCMELCEQLGPAPEHLPSLTGVFQFYVYRGELDLAEETLDVDRRRLGLEPDDAIPAVGGRGPIRFFRGDFKGAVSDFESFLRSPYASMGDQTPDNWPFPDDPVVMIKSFLGLTRWIGGDPAGAMASLDEAEVRADLLVFPHRPFSLGFAKLIRVLVFRFAGRDDDAEIVLDEIAALAERHGFEYFSTAAAAQRALGGLRRGMSMDQFSTMIGKWQALGADTWNPWAIAEGAASHMRSGNLPAALLLAEAALGEADRKGCHFYDAEITRIRGEVLIASGDPTGAEVLDRAAALAHGQGARVFELRARLARCALADDAEARARLAACVAALHDAPGLAELDDARLVLAGAGEAQPSG